MATTAFQLKSPPDRQEELVAWLDEPEVGGLLQDDDLVTVYAFPEQANAVRTLISRAPAGLVTEVLSEEEIADRNWNEEWEQSIEPVLAGPFRVRPTWNAAPLIDGVQDILIDPKMSFGTGHHESTRLILGAMPDKVVAGGSVLDAGTGTGVLAFGALLLGASQAEAFDLDPICIENAGENAVLNGLEDRFSVFLDDGSNLNQHIGESTYDLVLANINREVLRSLLPTLKRRMGPHAVLGLAGLLKSDAPMIRDDLAALGMEVVDEAEEGAWWSVWAKQNQADGRG